MWEVCESHLQLNRKEKGDAPFARLSLPNVIYDMIKPKSAESRLERLPGLDVPA